MASITIDDLPEQTKESLRVQAVQSGVSLESYVKQILQLATRSHQRADKVDNILTIAENCFGQDNGIELDLPKRGSSRQEITFE